MRMANIKMTYEGLKKGLKYMLCYISLGTMLGMPVSSSAANAKPNPRFQAKNVQTIDWNTEYNYFPMDRMLYTADYMENSFVNYSNENEEALGPDDLVLVYETYCVPLTRRDYYFKKRYRIWFHDIKVSDIDTDESYIKISEALTNIINGQDIDEDVEILSIEDVVIKSIEPLDDSDELWIEDRTLPMEYETTVFGDNDEMNLLPEPSDEPPLAESKKNMIPTYFFGAAAVLAIVLVSGNLMSGNDSDTKRKRYLKMLKR